MIDIEFYREQADRCAAEASRAVLPKQRAKFLVAERAWRNLADESAGLRRNHPR
jgi:hypothetical protein